MDGPPAPIDFPDIAQHVVQRGIDRQARFADDADFLHYRQALGDAALKRACAQKVRLNFLYF